MSPTTYLVFGDLHGHVLPAFRLAQVWSREHGVDIDGLLQVGDLGDSRFDKPKRRKEKAWLQDGRRLLPQHSEDADAVFQSEPSTGAMWFTAGNHENYELLGKLDRRAKQSADSFTVDAYGQLRCVRDGRVAELPGGLRVGAVWGIDDKAPRARERTPPCARIRRRSLESLQSAKFDVSLTHESPRDAVLSGNGSEGVGSLVHAAQPKFAFFGHYHSTGKQVEGDFGVTRVYHLSHIELDSRAEEGSVGVLTWDGDNSQFEYLDPDWLRTVTRHNWKHR